MRELTEAERVSRECHREMMTGLTPAQRTRLNGIRWQSPSVLVHPEPELVQALGLTPEQLRQIEGIVHEYQRRILATRPLAPMRVVESRASEEPTSDGRGVMRSRYQRRESVLDEAGMEAVSQQIGKIAAEEHRVLHDEVLTPVQQATLARLRGAPLR
jgi:hypothetical protein